MAIEAVAGVDVTGRGFYDVYGYLGTQRRRKTTSLRMMLGLVRPRPGRCACSGAIPCSIRLRRSPAWPDSSRSQPSAPYPSGRANLSCVSPGSTAPAAQRHLEVLELVELTGRAHDRVRGYSHGMRQRLGLAAALLRSPRLLVLDEPTTGLDPAGMRDMRALVRRLAGEGITVLLSSHLMNEVEELCNRVAILREGRVRYEGGLADLLARSAGRHRLLATDPARAFELARAAEGIRDVHADAGAVLFAADRDAVAALTLALAAAGIGIHALVPAGGLEELFFDLTDPEPA